MVFIWKIKEPVERCILKLTEDKTLGNLVYLDIWQFSILIESKNKIACFVSVELTHLIFFLNNYKRKDLINICLNSRLKEIAQRFILIVRTIIVNLITSSNF